GVDDQWIRELMDAGASPMHEGNPHQIGYQALAPLLEHGQYDERFLVPVAEHMVRLDKANDGMLGGGGIDNPYVIGPSDSNANPLNSALVALDNNPDAAAAFFSNPEEYLPYNAPEDGPYITDGLNTGTNLAPTGNNVEYLLDRASDSSYYDHGGYINPDRLGNALEAGATGMSSDAPSDATPPQHTEANATVAERTVSYFGGENVDKIEPGGNLEATADNVTDVVANHMVDVHNSLLPSGGQDDVSVDHPGAESQFDRAATERLLYGLGKHEDSVLTLSGANEAATAVLVAEGYEQYGGDPANNTWIEDAVDPGGKINGILADGSVTEIVEAGQASDEEHNERADLIAGGVNTVLGQTPLDDVPIAGGLYEDLVNGVAESYHVDTRVETTYDGQVDLDSHRSDSGERMASAVEQALVHTHGLTPEAAQAYVRERGLSGSDFEDLFDRGYGVVEDDWR
ncbi:MAG: DUF6571 family protein, partial [Stackebrandtia sp.]